MSVHFPDSRVVKRAIHGAIFYKAIFIICDEGEIDFQWTYLNRPPWERVYLCDIHHTSSLTIYFKFVKKGKLKIE